MQGIKFVDGATPGQTAFVGVVGVTHIHIEMVDIAQHCGITCYGALGGHGAFFTQGAPTVDAIHRGDNAGVVSVVVPYGNFLPAGDGNIQGVSMSQFDQFAIFSSLMNFSVRFLIDKYGR